MHLWFQYLKVCDNWREISLLDVAGKQLGIILQVWLQLIAKSVCLILSVDFIEGIAVCI